MHAVPMSVVVPTVQAAQLLERLQPSLKEAGRAHLRLGMTCCPQAGCLSTPVLISLFAMQWQKARRSHGKQKLFAVADSRRVLWGKTQEGGENAASAQSLRRVVAWVSADRCTVLEMGCVYLNCTLVHVRIKHL